MGVHPNRRKHPRKKRPKVKDPRMDSLVEAAWDDGADCVAGGKNHVKVYPPDGSRMIPIPSTPSDSQRTYRNKRSALRRAGIDV
jgi:hypothetical protein